MSSKIWSAIVLVCTLSSPALTLASPGEIVPLQGLHGNTLVAGKTTAIRMYVDQTTFDQADAAVVTTVRPDGSLSTKTWTKPEFVFIPTGSRGPSVVVRIRGADVPWVGTYQVRAKLMSAGGATSTSFLLDKMSLAPTKDLIVGVDRVHANDKNPAPPEEIQATRDALARLASIWPIRDGISEPDVDRTAGLRFVINNNPQPYGCNGDPKVSDCQLCPFFASRINRPQGSDVMNLGIGTRFLDAAESGIGGIAPNFCPNQTVGWASIVMSAPSAPGIAQETGHVFGLEPANDPHYDTTVQAGHSKDNTIAPVDVEQGFDIQTNAAFPATAFDAMHQAVCGCQNNEVTYNTWDWEFLRNKFVALASTGPDVPDQFMSDTSPALAGVGNSIYIFARRADGRVMFDRAVLGQKGSGWREVDGDGRTDSAPASAAIGRHVFVAIRGMDGRIQINQADQDRPFGGWFPMNFTTDVAPAVAAVGNSIFVIAKGMDRRIYASQAVLGQGFSGWFQLQGGGLTDSSPSAAAVGSHLFVAIKGIDGRLQLNQADFGHPFSGWSLLNMRTTMPPGLVGVNDRIFVFATTPDGRVMLSQAVIGHGFSGWFEVQGNLRSNRSPAGASVGGHVFVAARSVDGRIVTNQADLGHAFGQWFP